MSSWSRSTVKPRRSSTPGRKFSRSTSARETSRARVSRPSSDFRSRVSDSLLRLHDRKYVDTGSSSGPTKRRPPAAGLVTADGALDLDDPGPHVGEHHAAVRSREGSGQVDHDDVVEGSTHGALLASVGGAVCRQPSHAASVPVRQAGPSLPTTGCQVVPAACARFEVVPWPRRAAGQLDPARSWVRLDLFRGGRRVTSDQPDVAREVPLVASRCWRRSWAASSTSLWRHSLAR